MRQQPTADPMRDALADALQAVAPEGVVLASLALDDAHHALLHADEAAFVACAGELRRREFATGRALLHRLLPGAGPILQTATGAPELDPSTVGSLAHDRQYALAAIASAIEFVALGVDLEPARPPDDELAAAVLRADDPAIDPLAAFTMKEAAYKAWSALGGRLIGPLDVQVQVEGPRFTAAMPALLAGECRPARCPAEVCGVAINASGYWLALAIVPTTRTTR